MDMFMSPVSSRAIPSGSNEVDNDDKENADPRLDQRAKSKGKSASGAGKRRRKVGGTLFGDDGFDVGEDLRLDSDDSKGGEDKDDDGNPMASLIRNRVVFVQEEMQLNLCSDSSENGASPLFLNQANRGFRRCISMVESTNISPISRNASFKRPAAPCLPAEAASHTPKRRKAPQDGSPSSLRSSSSPSIGGSPALPKPLSRSKSMLDSATAAQILEAVSLDDDCLTGDKRCRLTLPTVKVNNKNCHLNNIDCHTLARVLRGEFDDRIGRLRILDARYCYEYEGGHVKGAENFGSWDEEAFAKEFFPSSMKPKPRESLRREDGEKRDILIFHCEFSSVRGPALLSKLRNRDRKLNQSTFPALHYPECYLLHEGYKKFFENYPEQCEPQSYVPMDHKDFAHEERKFHRKSKSWAGGGGGGGGATVSRTGASSRLLKL